MRNAQIRAYFVYPNGAIVTKPRRAATAWGKALGIEPAGLALYSKTHSGGPRVLRKYLTGPLAEQPQQVAV